MSRDLTLYSRPGCHLCNAMKAVAERVIAGHDVQLAEVNIDLDPGLVDLYDDQVPVLVLDGRRIAKYRIDEAALQQALAAPAPGGTD